MKRAGTTRRRPVKKQKADREIKLGGTSGNSAQEPTGQTTRRSSPQPTTWGQCTLGPHGGSGQRDPPQPPQLARQGRREGGEGGGSRRGLRPRQPATRVLGGCTLLAARWVVCKGERPWCVVDSPTVGRGRMATARLSPEASSRRRRMYVVFLLILPGVAHRPI